MNVPNPTAMQQPVPRQKAPDVPYVQKPDDPVTLHQFLVKIEDKDIGCFTGCDGLSAEYTFEDLQEGGNNAYVHRLPGRVKYTNVKLTRALNAQSLLLAAWFSDFQKHHPKRSWATISLLDQFSKDRKPICIWILRDVHPVKWSGPNFSVDGNGSAKETLELAHHGFEWKQQ